MKNKDLLINFKWGTSRKIINNLKADVLIWKENSSSSRWLSLNKNHYLIGSKKKVNRNLWRKIFLLNSVKVNTILKNYQETKIMSWWSTNESVQCRRPSAIQHKIQEKRSTLTGKGTYSKEQHQISFILIMEKTRSCLVLQQNFQIYLTIKTQRFTREKNSDNADLFIFYFYLLKQYNWL